MPLYDFECLSCKKEFEEAAHIEDRNSILCPKCGKETKILISGKQSRGWFKPHWNEHFTGKPVFVKSKTHFKELCLEHNVTSSALGDIRNIHQMEGKPES